MGALLGLDGEPAVGVRGVSGPCVVVRGERRDRLSGAPVLAVAKTSLDRRIAFSETAGADAVNAPRIGGALAWRGYSPAGNRRSDLTVATFR
jgi:hypothetical protein